MEPNIDYSTYTYKELLEARQHLDVEQYPDRAVQLDKLIAEHNQKFEQQHLQEEHKIVREITPQFHGNAKEYFSIWIVNLLLTIVTLGVYSPWAKVRNTRYIYGNTEADGHRFTYLASPIQILKGRVIAAVLLVGYYMLATISPFSGAMLAIGLVVFMPFLVVQSLKFKMKVTGYRNIRFSFHGKYGRAFVVFVLYPFLSLFTFYLAMPFALAKMDEFIIDNIQYGDKSFETKLQGGTYWEASFISALMTIPAIFVLFQLGLVSTDPEVAQNQSVMLSILTMLAYLVIYTVCGSYYQARIRNHIYDNSELNDVAKFDSDFKFTELAWLNFSNLVLLVLTFGLALPLTQVRKQHYFCRNTTVRVMAGADSVLASQETSGNAIGDEIAEAFDLDVAIG
ncbi:DUF898 domain-containing protein [Thalassotalea sp. LPB0316]|uniref:YjgN family protein n=1 Tax=Thalassotalea sp. LPB0316 TaxID=2769490 RepID=UPI00186943BE|nr:YjgN family protein [Thalassotalea sp. LPB0316]QOL25726.1 DUF898 domain-containing protein [Thalassotalea sp. LPB0316]